ncbi:FkbM family methyltransferase [Amylibacter sp.]|nr:FkbM family methyltransferase [Amylibacter sp.]
MFVFYDLGAEGGIPERWESKQVRELFSEMEIVAFDLDEKKVPLDTKQHSLKLIDKIISDSDEIKDFYIPERDSGSSLFPFNDEYFYLHNDNYHPLKKIVSVETTSLKSLIESDKISPADIIKMDIQGAELRALKGLGKYIENVSVIEIEVEFLQIYEGQPTFNEIHKYLMSVGFHLQDLHLSKSFLTNGKIENYYQKKVNPRNVNTNWTPQVYAGDALYVKSLDSVLMLSLDDQIRHIKCLCAYNCFDRALMIVDSSQFCEKLKDSEIYEILLKHAKFGYRASAISNFFSRVMRKVGITAPLTVDKKFPWIERSHPNL